MKTDAYLERTDLLDYDDPRIEDLLSRRRWPTLPVKERIGSIHRFVRDEIAFGYNADDRMPASEVLHQGYGQCNTKGILLLALLRGSGVPSRFHGFTIDNRIQKGAIPGALIPLAPKEIIHSWVEAWFRDEWIPLEGFILDRPYLTAVQQRHPATTGRFAGYAIATSCLANPPVEWQGSATYIQNEGIVRDFGVYDTPDAFFDEHGTNLSGLKRLAYRHLFRHVINLNVARIRAGSGRSAYS